MDSPDSASGGGTRDADAVIVPSREARDSELFVGFLDLGIIGMVVGETHVERFALRASTRSRYSLS